MNINPNLRNPLALFALCFLVVESVMTSILIYRVNDIVLCPCIVKMLFIFIVAFPLIVFIGFYVLLWCKADVLFSPYENALAEQIRNMGKKEIVDNKKAKDAKYGISLQASEDTNTHKKSKIPVALFSEEEILNQYISQYVPFLQKNIKVETRNGIRYFDAYANWNGCNYVVEVKQLTKWTDASKQGVTLFVSNARSLQSPIHMTLVLYIIDNNEKQDRQKIVTDIHNGVDPAINIVFASINKDTNNIEFSYIY